MTAKKRGRPTDYNPQIAEEICAAIASTTKSIKRLCCENENWPGHATIFQWLIKHKEFQDQYALAKKWQAQTAIDEIYDIADDSSQDTLVDDDGNVRPNTEFIQRSRIRIDTRKWAASKQMAKIYGDRPSADPADSESDEQAVSAAVRGLLDAFAVLGANTPAKANGKNTNRGRQRAKSS